VTAPTPDETGGRPAAAAAAPKLRRGQVVQFTHADPIRGGKFTDVGVILVLGGEGEAVTIRPLASYDVLVDPADVQPVSVDEVAG
jgi:hypothetical protein